MFKPTRKQEVQSLTATNAEQTVTMPSSYAKVFISTVGTAPNDAIRVSINGSPAAVTGSAGFLIVRGNPLVIRNHAINVIKYIRDGGAGANVEFSILGMWN